MHNQYNYSDWQTYIALTLFVICWLLFAKRWRLFPVGRTASALLGGSLMVIFQVITPEEAYKSISGDTLLLLCSLMLILAKLEEKGITEPLKQLLLRGNPSPTSLLVRVSLLSALLGAFIMNDGSAIFLSNLVFEIATENGLDIEPFAMAIATSANIGSSATVIGNPKNMLLISKMPKISFLGFTKVMGIASTTGVLLNTFFLVLYYRKILQNVPMIEQDDKVEFTDSDENDIEDDTSDTGLLEIRRDYTKFKLKAKISKHVCNGQNSTSIDIPRLTRAKTNINSIRNDQIVNKNNNFTYVGESPRYCAEYTESPKQIDSIFDTNNTVNIEISNKVMTPEGSFNDEQNYFEEEITRYVWPIEPDGSDVDKNEAQTPELSTNSEFEKIEQSIQQTDSFNVHKNLFFVISILVLMYVGFLFQMNLGFVSLTASILVIVVDRKDANTFINDQINWALISYLIGVFILLAGILKTPVADFMWSQFRPYIDTLGSGLLMPTLIFDLLVVLLSFVFTSIPAVLLLSPYIKTIGNEVFSTKAWFLLSWCVTLCGNLTAFGSIAGLVVSEVSKEYSLNNNKEEGPNSSLLGNNSSQWIGDFKVWSRYCLWSTVVIIVAGSVLIIV